MKAKRKTRILSLLLCVVMLVGMMPTSLFAAGNAPITTDKVYTYQRIDSVDDIVPGKHFIIVAEYTNETTGETSYYALGAKMSFYDGFRLPQMILIYAEDNTAYPFEKDLISIDACIENILLSATEKNYGSCVIGELFDKQSEIAQHVNVNTEGFKLICGIVIGRSA